MRREAAEDRLAAGVISSAHGVRGAFSVRCYSGNGAHLQGLKEVVLGKGAEEKRFRVISARARADDLLFTVERVDTREKAQELIGCVIWVDRKDAAPLSKDEYYEADLCRCGLYLGERLIGRVRSVLDAGQSQLLEVSGEGGREILVPFINHFIAVVDVEKGRISLRGDELLQ